LTRSKGQVCLLFPLIHLISIGLFASFPSIGCDAQGAHRMRTAQGENARAVHREAAAQPIVAFDYLDHDFGSVVRGHVVKHAFAYRNAGNAPLVINKTATDCACEMSVSADKRVAGGAFGQVALRFDASSLRGAQERRIQVSSNDPENAVTTLTVRGFVVCAEPDEAHFGNVYPEQGALRTIVIEKPKEMPLRIVSIHSSAPFLSSSLVEDLDRGRFVLDIRLDPAAPLGPLHEMVQVAFGSEEGRVLSIPATGRVKGTVAARPDPLLFGIVWKGSRAAKALQVYSNVAGTSLEITRVTTDIAGMTAVISQSEDRTQNEIALVLDTTHAPTGSLHGNITIETRIPGPHTLTVPVHCMIMAND